MWWIIILATYVVTFLLLRFAYSLNSKELKDTPGFVFVWMIVPFMNMILAFIAVLVCWGNAEKVIKEFKRKALDKLFGKW